MLCVVPQEFDLRVAESSRRELCAPGFGLAAMVVNIRARRSGDSRAEGGGEGREEKFAHGSLHDGAKCVR